MRGSGSTPFCRFCCQVNMDKISSTYSSVLVSKNGDFKACVDECESSLCASFSVWCNRCEKISITSALYPCLEWRSDQGPKDQGIPAQVALWRRCSSMKLCGTENHI